MFNNLDVPHVLQYHADTRADHPFLIWEPFEGAGKTWTYAEFNEDVCRIGAGLKAKGIKAGDTILLHFDNCPEILLAWYACARIGAVALTTNARSAGAELEYFAENSGAVAAITQPKFRDLVAQSCKEIKWMLLSETDNGALPEKRVDAEESFDNLLGDPKDAPLRPADPLLDVGVQYTSGTTSRPKGVVWTHANALWGGRTCSMQQDLRPEDIHLVYLPLFHTNAQAYSVLSSLWVGATIVVQPRFSASRFWEVSLKHSCTWTSMVPFCLKALLDKPVPKHSYRLWGNGICEPASDAHFNVKTIGWWGMTETIAPGVVGSVHFPNTPMTMGRPSIGVEIAVVGPDGGDVSPGETGDLKIRGIPGISLFKEYLNNLDATENSFDEEGFFVTGDRVTMLPDGYLAFADRDKDMMKVGGENVAASEIERVIATLPEVAEVAVVARKDKMLDEVPVAFLLVPGGVVPDDFENQVIDLCRSQLADFKVPREVRIVTELPRSTLEKIAKNKLRAQLDG